MQSNRCPLVIKIVFLICLFGGAGASAQNINDGYSFTTLSDPLALSQSTTPTAISDGIVVGGYNVQFSAPSFIYNGSQFTTLIDPGQGGDSPTTVACGISGNTIVGYYTGSNSAEHGFIYNIPGATFTTLDDPAGTNTTARGVSGNTIVGTYEDSHFVTQGFVYNGSNFTTISDPSAISDGGTFVTGISGNNIVGYYGSGDGYQGFIYNGSTWTTLSDPLGGNFGTYVTGMSGNTIVGYYDAGGTNYHGFVYNGSTFATVDDPLATGIIPNALPDRTQIFGISENGTIVGTFDGSTAFGGFIATPVVPEPASCALLAGAGLLLVHRRRRRWTAL